MAECYNIHNIKISEKYTPHLLIAMEEYATIAVEHEQMALEKEKAETINNPSFNYGEFATITKSS